MTTLIYALVDPFTLEVRYVGMTRKPMQQRYRQHLQESRSERCKNTWKAGWIRSLTARGEAPWMMLLEECDGDGEAEERKFITYMRSFGCTLCNLTDGGEAPLGYVFTPEVRAKMSKAKTGHRHSEETKQKIGDKHRGIKLSPEACDNIRNGASNRNYKAGTKERLAELARKNFLGKKKTAETKNKMSISAKSRSAEHLKKISDGIRRAYQQKKVREVSYMDLLPGIDPNRTEAN